MQESKSSPYPDAQPTDVAQDGTATSVIARRLHDFFAEQGLPRHKHASQLAVILGLSRSGAFRKFQDSSFSAGDLQTLAQHFQVDVSALLSAPSPDGLPPTPGDIHAARIFVGTSLLACRVHIGSALAAGEHWELVATPQSTGWLVQPFAMAHESLPRHRVLQLVITPKPRDLTRIAVLEDSRDLAGNVKDALQGAGFQVELFNSAAELTQRAASAPFDAYVMDWWLGGQTAAPALQAIRGAQPGVPLILTTGAIATGHAVEDDIVRVAVALRVQVVEKPFRLALLISQVKQMLDEAGHRTA